MKQYQMIDLNNSLWVITSNPVVSNWYTGSCHEQEVQHTV